MVLTVGLVTTDLSIFTYDDEDAPLLETALRRVGVEVEHPQWRDPHVDWAAFDGVIIRSPWDYERYPTELAAWLDRVSSATRMLNPAELIRWNSDKRYLMQLAGHGAPPAPTTFCSTMEDVSAALDIRGRDDVVVKPTISAGSRHTGLFSAQDPAALSLAETIFSEGKLVMVQDVIASVANGAERGLVYVDGEFSHAFSKGAILDRGGLYRGGQYTEVIRPAEATDDEVAFGDTVMAAINAIARDNGWGADAAVPLYARIDMATDLDGTVKLLEAELFEPSLYFATTSADAPSRMAAAVVKRLR